jgi:hypothetical protein
MIPWTTPQLVEIRVTLEQRAELERSPAYVAPGEVALVPEDSQGAVGYESTVGISVSNSIRRVSCS